MNAPGLIVIGSGPAGVCAAATFRQHNDQLPVHIITADPDLPYARPPLSKEFLRGETDDVALHPGTWFADRSIELVYGAIVDGIDLAEHSVIAGGVHHRYQALVLACGASPAPLPVPGGETALQLRSLADAARLRQAGARADSAVVIGAGFIGCEAAASLSLRGIAVTVVAPEAAPQIQRLGPEAAERLVGLLSEVGVRFVGGVAVEAIDGGVRLDNGVTINTDLVLAATGVRPQSSLAEAAGLDVRQSRIVVGPDMATSADDVYAAGDAALAFNATAGRHLAVEHWQDAADQGAVAGAGAAGRSAKWEAVPGFWTTIGHATVKYHAWGDGYQHSRLLQRENGFTVWYEADGAAVGVLTCNADEDYDLGQDLISQRKPAPAQVAPTRPPPRR
ncbi:MAG: FAD-dependent oxidoreductase [Mycolicibacterium sp.]|nr:FAD-dependent oxidoreductase [Mycolicibacterium sp.]